MGVKLSKKALQVATKNQLANAERQVASRRPGTLDKSGLERLPTSNMINASEQMLSENKHVIGEGYNTELGKNLETLTGSILQSSDFVLPQRSNPAMISSLPRVERTTAAAMLEYTKKYYKSNSQTFPDSTALAKEFDVDEEVEATLLKYHAVASTVDRVDGGQAISLGLWPYPRPDGST